MHMTAAVYIKAPHSECVCACLKADSFIFILLLYCGSAVLGNLILSSAPSAPNAMKRLCTENQGLLRG